MNHKGIEFLRGNCNKARGHKCLFTSNAICPNKVPVRQAHFRNLKTFWEYSGMMKNTYDGGAVAFHHVTIMDDIFKSYSKQLLAG